MAAHSESSEQEQAEESHSPMQAGGVTGVVFGAVVAVVAAGTVRRRGHAGSIGADAHIAVVRIRAGHGGAGALAGRTDVGFRTRIPIVAIRVIRGVDQRALAVITNRLLAAISGRAIRRRGAATGVSPRAVAAVVAHIPVGTRVPVITSAAGINRVFAETIGGAGSDHALFFSDADGIIAIAGQVGRHASFIGIADFAVAAIHGHK